MKTNLARKRIKRRVKKILHSSLTQVFLLDILMLLFFASFSFASPQATPPFVTSTLAPNVLISIDTSGSMRWGHSGLNYPNDAVYIIAESIYNDPYHGPYSYDGNDYKAEVIQIADDISDSSDRWLSSLPGVTGTVGSLHYDPSVFIDLTSHITDIKNNLSSFDHKTMSIGGINWIVFKGSWGASNYKFQGPYGIGNLSRITMAKWVVSKLIRNTTGIQYGIMVFQNGCSETTGARIVFPCKDLTEDYDGNGHADKEDLINYVSSIYAQACTPLANDLYEACRYFGGETSSCGATYSGAFASKIMVDGHYVSPIQYWCQKNFVILTTDGESYEDGGNIPANIQDYDDDNNPNDGAGATSDSLDDVALYAYDRDFRPSLGNGQGEEAKQNFLTYTIGFGGAAATLLQEAADENHGHGQYYGATDQESLYASLQSAINDILYRISSGTAVAVLSTSQSVGDKLFRARFHPRGWRGYLECFKLPLNGNDTPLWEAGELLRNQTASSRTIYTATSATTTAQESFDTSNSNLTASLLDVDPSNRNNLINYIRGDYDPNWVWAGTTNHFRDRDPDEHGGDQWKLGDIVYSTPVVRDEPNAYWDAMASSGAFDGYSDFKAHRYNRMPLVIVGANDGMLHAFKVSDGSEVWAFIPHNLLYNLKSLAHDPYTHNYYVDLTPVISDCQVGSSVAGDHGWKTILLSGERQGGKAYFALDVTGDTGYPVPLWEFMDPNLGESWSIPDTGLVSTSSGYRWIGIFGSGYENGDTKGHLYGVNMADGSKIFDLKVDDASNNVMASPVAIDFNDNALTDRIYIGDMLGRMWKITPKTNEVWGDATTLQASILTSTGFVDNSGHFNKQPIRIKPSLSFYQRTNGKVMAVYFGTGKFDLTEDKTNTDTQSFYCVLDEGYTELTRNDLVDSDHPGIDGYCSEHGQIPADKHGWYFNLPNEGERVTASSLLVGGIVFFTTFTPNNDVCGYGGVARLYAVKYDTGCAPDKPVMDVNGDNIVDSTDTSTGQEGGPIPKSIIIGNGLPSAPVYDPKRGKLYIQLSSGELGKPSGSSGGGISIDPHLKTFKVHYWREIFK